MNISKEYQEELKKLHKEIDNIILNIVYDYFSFI